MELWNHLRAMILGDASKFNLTIRLCIAASFAFIQCMLIWLTVLLFRGIKKKISVLVGKYIPTLTIRKFRILESAQILGGLYFILRALKYVVIFVQLFLIIPLIFSLFAPTQNLAATLFGYVLTPLKQILHSLISYIPNLITIVIFVLIANYAIRSLKFFATRIEREKLVIPGFYPDWAQPTFNILRFLIYAFTIAVIYPYLPGSDSRIFQGVSVFVGIIVSFGSTSAINNLVAGIVLTYMRPFKLGDRIQIQNVTGFVVEKSPVIIRLRTHKNEYVTFPNSMALTSNIINYHTSTTENEQGLILYADITFGYTTPWETVHELLIAAALKTSHVLAEPKPFVLQTSLDDFYAHYQINAYTKNAGQVPAIYSELFSNIQSGFREAGLDLTAAHFRINLPTDARRNFTGQKSGSLP
ncbi:MAG: mechanosensitive ion channel family protein [Treponema sp.]|jgi:small-conductance mechanosensitive channel|nr:mechanosensitive ion channel family protein [Treponema sp.]